MSCSSSSRRTRGRRGRASVAVEGAEDRLPKLAEALRRAGATRITSFEKAPWPPPWWRHDGASVFAGLILLSKYASPPEFIGPMNSKQTLVAMPEMHSSGYLPMPSLGDELFSQLGHPFLIVSTVGYCLTLGWRGVR